MLVLGREANARYVSGADRLWLAGTRPFSPGCVLPATGAVHLLSITDDGLPGDIPTDQLYPISWNPMDILGNLAAIPGVADARTVGVDGMTPLFEQLLGAVLPEPRRSSTPSRSSAGCADPSRPPTSTAFAAPSASPSSASPRRSPPWRRASPNDALLGPFEASDGRPRRHHPRVRGVGVCRRHRPAGSRRSRAAHR